MLYYRSKKEWFVAFKAVGQVWWAATDDQVTVDLTSNRSSTIRRHSANGKGSISADETAYQCGDN
ncbi:MAG: hypothetical protein KJZ86_24740, partial [Caldilineaceae bacterium]|nr:hypothetical protein [Caldilineaceae bacterium]